MYRYITTVEALDEVLEEFIKPYCADSKDNILALDLETYLTSFAGILLDDVDEDDEEALEETVGKLVADVIQTFKDAKKLSDRPIPRPLKLADGSYTGQIRTLSLGLDPDNAFYPGGIQFVIDIKAIGYEEVAKRVKPLLERQLILGHNLKYDYQFLWALMGITLRRMLDTMLVARILGCGTEKGFSLGDCYDRYIDFHWFKSQTGMDFKDYKDYKSKNQKDESWEGELKETQLQYAADDVLYIFYVWREEKARVSFFSDMFESDIEQGTGIRSVIKLECQLIPVIAHAELRGVKVDVIRHAKEVIPKLEDNRDRAIERVPLTRTYTVKKTEGRKADKRIWEEEVTEKIKLSSPEQLKIALFDLLKGYGKSSRQTLKWNKKGLDAIKDGLDPWKTEGAKQKVDKCYITFTFRNDDGLFDEEVLINTRDATIKRFVQDHYLREQIAEETQDVIRDILIAKQAMSLLSKFGAKLVRCCTDRGYIHTNFNQLGTESGRMSSGGKHTINCQQIPSKHVLKDGSGTKLVDLFRSSFCSEEGWRLVVADYAQLQARFAALFCNAKDLVWKFSNDPNFDIHGEVARSILNLSYTPAKSSPERKDVGKTFGFSALFGAYGGKIMTFMRDETDGRVVLTKAEADQMRTRFFTDFPDFERKRIEYEQSVETLPRESGYTVYPFRFLPKESRTVPFFWAKSMGKNFRRTRVFSMPREWNRYPQHVFHKRYKPTDEERREWKLPYGNFYSKLMGESFREAFNHEIQGGEANLVKVAALLIHNELLKNNFPLDEGIIMIVHDEFVLHVREEKAELARDIVDRCMRKANEILGTDGVKVDTECKIGRNWYEAK